MIPDRGGDMRTTASLTWVVYVVPTSDPAAAPRAVCTTAEWAALERDRPGIFTLVRADIPTEPEAERLARGAAGQERLRPRRVGPFDRRREEATEAALVVPAAAS
jgi:hypothetical protein